MEINLITQETYNTLLEIFQSYPTLTYQNKGYDELNLSDLSEGEKNKHQEVTEILKKVIKGFSRFQNFRLRPSTGLPEIRLQYNYHAYGDGLPFVGVGYIHLHELLHGFDTK